ncbi:MAG: hypothetical protein ACYC6Y_15265 [Thermoguttaceae bacterium]
MLIRGRVQNGVVVLELGASLLEGTPVTVVVRAESEPLSEPMSNEQRRRLRETRQYFEALPNENPGDNFSGADHDRVLYGNR